MAANAGPQQPVAFGGEATTTSYVWSSSLATAGMGTFGGWTRTATFAHGYSLVDKTDPFGRTIGRTDMGGRTTSFTYDKAGRLTQQTGSSGQSQTIAYFNIGRAKQIVDNAGTGLNSITGTFGYDAAGNRIAEAYSGTVWSFHFPSSHTSATQTLQNATFTYDALGRMTKFVDKDAAGAVRITVDTQYDRAGNVMRVHSTYPNLAYPQYGSVTTDQWYRYDAMGRMVIAEGKLESGQIVRGSGMEVTYDAAGRLAVERPRHALPSAFRAARRRAHARVRRHDGLRPVRPEGGVHARLLRRLLPAERLERPQRRHDHHRHADPRDGVPLVRMPEQRAQQEPAQQRPECERRDLERDHHHGRESRGGHLQPRRPRMLRADSELARPHRGR